MPNEKARPPRRRPVDVLFGEEVELKPKTEPPPNPQPPPGYMVEPPRPVTSVQPPPVEYPKDWRGAAPAEPARVVESPPEAAPRSDPVAPPPRPAQADKPAPVVAEAVTFTRPPQTAARGPVPVRRQGLDPMAIAMAVPVIPAPAAMLSAVAIAPASSSTALYGQSELIELSQFVDQLYQNVADETSDSAALNAECLASLKEARAALEANEYSKAEAAAERVKSRLLRARASRAAAASAVIGLLVGWILASGVLGIVLFAAPFFIRLLPEVVPFIRAIGLGMLGGALLPLWQIPGQVVRREYDAALTIRNALSPVIGGLSGAVVYLLSVLGILAAPSALGLMNEPLRLLYLVAFLTGLFNDRILAGLRSLIPGVRK